MKNKRTGIYIELTNEERKIICELKKLYAINISQLVKNLIKEYYEQMEKNAHAQ